MSAPFENSTLFLDDDGDLCITGRVNNLVACPAHDDAEGNWADLNPDVFPEIIKRWDAYTTSTDLSQASVAAALEAAAMKNDNFAAHLQAEAFMFLLRDVSEAARLASEVAKLFKVEANAIRALITPDQRTALAAHVAAEVAKARAEEFNRGVRAGCYAALAHLDRHDYREDVTRSGLQDEILAAQIGAKP